MTGNFKGKDRFLSTFCSVTTILFKLHLQFRSIKACASTFILSERAKLIDIKLLRPMNNGKRDILLYQCYLTSK